MPGSLAHTRSATPRARRGRPLVRNAAVVALRAALALAVAGFAWGSQSAPLAALLNLFAAWSALDGGCAIVWALFGARRGERCAALLLAGSAGLAAGTAAAFDGELSVHAGVWLMACWALSTGVTTIGATLSLPGRGRVALAALGAVSVVWGLLLLLWPVPGPATLARLLAALALPLGVANAVLVWRLLRTGRVAPAD